MLLFTLESQRCSVISIQIRHTHTPNFVSKKALPMENNQENALTLMRKSVEKLGFSTEKHGDLTLRRFLIAREMDPVKAANMFVQWCKWRTALVPNGYISDSEVPDQLDSRKICLQGLSQKGYPLLIARVNRHFPSKDQLQLQKFVVQVLDKTLASSFRGKEIGNEKLVVIIDLQKLSYKNADTRAFITGFQFLQAYYPERLAKCFILHMPRFFVAVWRLIARFLDKATLEKIVIVSSEEEKKDLIKEIGEAVVPEEYGGRAKLVVLQDVILPPPNC